MRDTLSKAVHLGLSDDFITWLGDNAEIWKEFVQLADQMRLRGRHNWSARAVLHVLRWHRALRDTTDEVFKINNNWSKEMATLYNAMTGVDFFRLRASPGDPFLVVP